MEILVLCIRCFIGDQVFSNTNFKWLIVDKRVDGFFVNDESDTCSRTKYFSYIEVTPRFLLTCVMLDVAFPWYCQQNPRRNKNRNVVILLMFVWLFNLNWMSICAPNVCIIYVYCKPWVKQNLPFYCLKYNSN